MKKSEKLTIVALVILFIFALVAIILQIISEKTGPLETAYEIIVFIVGLVAVVLAIFEGRKNAKIAKRIEEQALEIKEIVENTNTLLTLEKEEIKVIEKDG